MLESSILADFELKMNDGETLMAHKSILAARSPVFRAMLTTKMKETAWNSVTVPDFCSKTMRELLRFIYCGEVDIPDGVTDLIFAAEKYELLELKEICINRLISDRTDENVVETLIIADQVSDSERLTAACVKIVMKYKFYAF